MQWPKSYANCEWPGGTPGFIRTKRVAHKSQKENGRTGTCTSISMCLCVIVADDGIGWGEWLFVRKSEVSLKDAARTGGE